MNARFRSGFIAILHRVPGFQKFCAKRFRGTNRYPNNGESIFLALNHQSYINKVNKKSNRIVKNDDYFNDDDGINGNGTD
jgi:predicted transglutaminase-like cysteine proteinase